MASLINSILSMLQYHISVPFKGFNNSHPLSYVSYQGVLSLANSTIVWVLNSIPGGVKIYGIAFTPEQLL